MVSPLPPRIQFKLEQTLAQWHQWQCAPPLPRTPEILQILTSGISNFSVLVESGQRFVVRIDGLNPGVNGLNRQTEWRTLIEAHKVEIAPHPRYFNPELGSLVCDYLEPESSRDENFAEVAGLLRKIHQLPARHHRLDLAERILRYEKQLEHRDPAIHDDLKDCRARVMVLLKDIRQRETRSVLCHNDLLRANRIYHDGKLWALDWEYCAMGSPWYDLAVIIHGDALGEKDSGILLQSYLGRAPSAGERAELYFYGCIYRYIELLWYQALDRPLPGEETIDEKSAALRKLLANH